MEAVVKKLLPEKNSGFLLHPAGGRDIFFTLQGHDTLPGEHARLPNQGDTVFVVKLDQNPQGPRAYKWRPKG